MIRTCYCKWRHFRENPVCQFVWKLSISERAGAETRSCTSQAVAPRGMTWALVVSDAYV